MIALVVFGGFWFLWLSWAIVLTWRDR